MSDIKVTTSDLWNYARELSSRAGDFSNIIGKYHSAFNKMRDSCSAFRSGAMIACYNQSVDRYVKIMENLTRGSQIAMNCALAYEEANTELINSYSGWFDDVEVNTIGGSTEAYIEEQIRKEEEYWDSLLDTTPADINSSNYFGPDNMSWNAHKGLEGQCTWYAYGRFLETQHIKLNSALNANRWLNKNETDDRLNVLRSNDLNLLKDQKIPCIGVAEGGKYGHVTIIEKIIYNADGSIKAVYITESNADNNGSYNPGVDAVLKKLVPGSDAFNDYINGLSGFICAK